MLLAGAKVQLGRCEIVGDEAIVTDFRRLGLLLFPVASRYVTGRRNERCLFELRTPGVSVALAYARWVILPCAFLSAAGAYSIVPGSFALELMVACGLAWVAAMVLTGRVRGVEARRRRVLAAAVGHAAPPELLFSDDLETILRRLEATWISRGAAASADGSLRDLELGALPLSYALSRYGAAANRDGDLEDRSRAAWIEIEARWTEIEPELASRPPVTAMRSEHEVARRRRSRRR